MLKVSSLYFLLVVSLFICACQTIPWFGEGKKNEIDAEEMKENEGIKEEQLKLDAIKKVDEFNLKIAKLWTKVDEQETRLLRQEEKILLLEKGLMLGIVPEELLAVRKTPLIESSTLPTKPADEENNQIATTDSKNSGPAKLLKSDKEKETKPILESGAYRELLKSAQEKFNGANYGQAIAIYQEIGENFPEETRQGQHLYWIGVSWYYLKEYQLASDALNNLAENYPEGPLTGQTRLFLARIDIKNGLRKKALERLRNIIADFANDEVGQMARYELSRLEESL
jgi:TolA-binding protein